MINEREHLEKLADRCELEMIGHAERSLAAQVGPVRTNARTAAAEMAIIAGTLRDRLNRLYPPNALSLEQTKAQLYDFIGEHRDKIFDQQPIDGGEIIAENKRRARAKTGERKA